MNPDVYLQIVHVHSPIVCSSTSQDVWDDCTQVLDQGLSFSLLGIFFTIRLLIETFKKGFTKRFGVYSSAPLAQSN